MASLDTSASGEDLALMLVGDDESFTDVTVNSHEIVTVSGSKRVVFWVDVKTESASFTVKRRFQQFEDLHAKVLKVFPKSKIPPLPSKGLIRSFSEEHLIERQNQLDSYVQALMALTEVRTSDTLAEFLENDDEAGSDSSRHSERFSDANTSAITFLLLPLPPKVIRVPPGGHHEVLRRVDRVDQLIIWEFVTKYGDIAMEVTLDGKPMRAYRRYNSHTKVVQGSCQATKPGIYSIKWDNSYSRVRTKKLTYKADVVTKDAGQAAAAAATDMNVKRTDGAVARLSGSAPAVTAGTDGDADSRKVSVLYDDELPALLAARPPFAPLPDPSPVRAELATVKLELAKAKEEHEETLATLLSLRSERDQLLGEQRVWSFERSDLEAVVASARASATDASLATQSMEKELGEQKPLIDALRREVDGLRRESADFLARETAVCQELREARMQLARDKQAFEEQLALQAAQLAAAERQVQVLKASAVESSKALADSADRYAKLKVQRKVLVEEVKRLQGELTAATTVTAPAPSLLADSLLGDKPASDLSDSMVTRVHDVGAGLASTTPSSSFGLSALASTPPSESLSLPGVTASSSIPVSPPSPKLTGKAFPPLVNHKFSRVALRYSDYLPHKIRKLDSSKTPPCFVSEPTEEESPRKLPRTDAAAPGGLAPAAAIDTSKDGAGQAGWGGFSFLSKAKEVAAGLVSGGPIHPDYRCCGCGMVPLRGTRWHCLECKNYDICDVCYQRGVHGHEREDVLHPLLNSEIQDTILRMAAGSTTKFSLLNEYFSRIDCGRIVEELPRPGYEIERLEPAVVGAFLRNVLPILQQRPEVTVHSEILAQPDEPTLKKLRIRCTLVDIPK